MPESGKRLHNGSDMAIVYDVMVRVDYDYENEYGDTRKAWSAWVGEITCDKPRRDALIVQYAVDNIIAPKINPPNNDMVRMISSKVTTYTINEVKSV